MELVYLWVEEYKNIKKQGFNFSPRFECTFHNEYNENGTLKENCKLEIQPKEHIENFFGDNINVTAIVGKNGSGKSSIIELLHNKIDTPEKGRKNYLILVKEDDKFYIWSSIKGIICDKAYSNNSVFIPKSTVQILNKKSTEAHHSFTLLNGYKQEFISTKNNTYSPLYDSPNLFIPKYVNAYRKNAFLKKIDESYVFDTLILKLNSEKSMQQIIDDIDDYDIKNYLKKLELDEKNETFLRIDSLEDLDTLSRLQKIYPDNRESELRENVLPIFDLGLLNSKTNATYESISDGEKQFTRLIVEILEHHETNLIESQIFLFDEVENSLHPSWQKKYFNEVLKIFDNIDKKVHLIFTTHSPFLLSDIPKQNIIFLDKDKDGNCKVVDGLKEKKQTFGANIHTLLSDSFFMEDGLMGEFAKGKINKAIKYLNQKTLTEEEIDYCENIVSIVGEPILENQLQRMLNSKRLSKVDKIDKLEEELELIKHRIEMIRKNQ